MFIHTPPTLSNADQAFLSARQVFSRYSWGKSKGYEMLKTTGFPNAIGGKYRLDSLIAWEDDILGGGLAAPLVPGPTGPTPVTTARHKGEDLKPSSLPTRRRTRGTARNGAL